MSVPTNPVAIITGASSGIGLATAYRLAGSGYHCVLVGRTLDPLNHAAARVPSSATVISADIGDLEAARGLIDRVDRDLGRIDILINNAGYAPLIPIGKTRDDDIDRAYRVNAMGPAALIDQAWPIFSRQQSGSIVNVSTLGTDDPFPGFFAYAASKGALNVMTRSCANEGEAIGVTAFAVAPGAVETPMLRSLFSKEQIPEQDCLTPDQVAEVICDCATGRRDADNGNVIWLNAPSSRTT